MEQLASALQREQELLELLLFKLVETRLLLAAPEMRFVTRATMEVERARQRTREADLLRAALVERLGFTGLRGRPVTLRSLAAESEQPWSGILRDHHDAMCALVAEIEMVAHQNARLARAGLQRIDTGNLVGATTSAVDPTSHGPSEDLADMADQAAYDAVLGAAGRLRMPALLSFLR